ncbi:MAG TPA: ATP-binding protein [Candidatus Acidoferrum sp.]|nr:ATP-binding protein [Candidatus Acidoferrum sp.]
MRLGKWLFNPASWRISPQTSLSLRTKLLLGLMGMLACLTCVTLLIVQRFAVVQAQREVEESARHATQTFELLEQKSKLELARKADLFAMLMSMRNGDPTSIDEVTEDPWLADTCTLLVLANREKEITASRPALDAEQNLKIKQLLEQRDKGGTRALWWMDEGRLYQVVLQPFYSDPPQNKTVLGTVVVGREMDGTWMGELARISSSQILFRRGGRVVISTLDALDEDQVAQDFANDSSITQLQTSRGKFYASSVVLNPSLPQGIRFTTLESYSGPMAWVTRTNRILVGVGFCAILAGLALAFMIAERFTRPLASLADGVRALQKGDYFYPLEGSGNDEVTRVTRAFDEMRRSMRENETERQQLEDQLRQSQKMDALGRLAGGVAHDFNNLLTVIKGHGDLLQDKLAPDNPLYGSSGQIIKAAERATSLTRQLLAFCRMQVLEPKVVDLNALVSEMCKLVRRLVREDIAFAFHAGESLWRVKADPGQLEQVIINLTVNASDAMPEGGKLTIEARNYSVDQKSGAHRVPLTPGDYVLLSVTDTGCGMDAATKSRIFEPFFTTKERGKGTGLGLATVYGVVKQSGGFILVESEPGKGAKFEVFLPRVAERADAQPEPGLQEERTKRKGTVLLAEDEEGVRELASEFLTAAGYEVYAAKDGVEALEIAEGLKKPLHLLVSDVVMPRMRGPELARRLKEVRSKIKVLYVSGYLEYNPGNSEFLEEGYFLQKPFSRDVLVRKVDEILAPKKAKQAGSAPSRVRVAGAEAFD